MIARAANATRLWGGQGWWGWAGMGGCGSEGIATGWRDDDESEGMTTEWRKWGGGIDERLRE